MSSLWTPDGERRVPASDDRGAAAPGSPEGPDDERFDPDDPAQAEVLARMAQLEAQLLDTPIEDVIANHCYGLFQLGALHLGQRPPGLESARLAIDALAGVVETLGDRLGDAAPTLRDGLAQIRLAYVQIAGATSGADGDLGALDDTATPGAEPDPGEPGAEEPGADEPGIPTP